MFRFCLMPATFVCLVSVAGSVTAGNVTLSTMFTGNESSMDSASVACESARFEQRPFREVGTFTVSETGDYSLLDASEQITLSDPRFPSREGVDNVIRVYDGPFSPGNPTRNQVLATDGSIPDPDNPLATANTFELQADTEYLLVVQNWCDPLTGVSAVVIRGPGDIDGLGSPSRGRLRGNFASVGDATDFGGFLGIHKYVALPLTVPESGTRFFYSLSQYVGDSETFQRIYEGEFDPDNPDEGWLQDFFVGGGSVYLEKGKQYTHVLVDVVDENDLYQIVEFTPGVLPFNAGLKGTWWNPSTSGQGVLLDYSELWAFLFLAIFTYEDSPPAGQSRIQSVGSAEQRWITAYAEDVGQEQTFAVKYENSTGGRFDSASPPVITDSSYGSGQLTIVDCDNITLTYELPDTPDGVFELTKTLPGVGSERCRLHRKAGEPRP